MIDDFVSSFQDQIVYVLGEYQLGGKRLRLNVTISSYERSVSGLRLTFIVFLHTTEQFSHARHAYIYRMGRERDKREKRRCNEGKDDSSRRRYEHNEDGTNRLHHDG
jgi:hypothetical protein